MANRKHRGSGLQRHREPLNARSRTESFHCLFQNLWVRFFWDASQPEADIKLDFYFEVAHMYKRLHYINIEALCAAPPEASAHSPSQMPLSCPVAPPSQCKLHKDRGAAAVAWRGGRAPPGPRSPSPAPRPVARPPQRPAPRRSRARPSCVT